MNPGKEKNVLILAISFHSGELNRYNRDQYQSLVLVDLKSKELVYDERVNQIAFRQVYFQSDYQLILQN